MLSGDNGILNQASKAKLHQEYSSVVEGMKLAVNEYVTEKETKETDLGFIDWLKSEERGYINNDNEIQIKALLGQELSTGRGSGQNDVYKLEEVNEIAKLASINIATIEVEQVKEYNIVYYDKDTSYEKEDKIIKALEKTLKDLNVKTDIKNESRVPIWIKKYNRVIKPYSSIEDAIARWGTTITCLGVRLENDKLKIYAPYGLEDLFSLIIRPVKIDFIKKDYELKTKRWKEKWPKLTIIPWE